MKSCSIIAGLATAALLLATGAAAAADDKAANPPANAKAAADGAKPAEKAKARAATLVDINSATKEDLARLPGVGAAEADKIVAGRPYGSKAHLLTRRILSPDAYQLVSKRVIARQATTDAGKNAELQKRK